MIGDFRYELFYFLYWRYKKYLPITTTQREFVITGIKRYSMDEHKEEDWELNKEDMVGVKNNIDRSGEK